jgi:hypothetical protein
MSIKIQAGKFYRQRCGYVAGPSSLYDEESLYRWRVGGYLYRDDGRHDSYVEEVIDLIAEVTVTDVLPFELKAGEKYETVKPDGTPGPVVELGPSIFSTHGTAAYFCFAALVDFDDNYDNLLITADGLCVGNSHPGNRYRITAPCVAPPPPTIAERLERAIELLANPRKDDSAFALIRGCVAELKAKEVARG